MKNKIIVLEKYKAFDCGVNRKTSQRIVYDAEQDRIIHQFYTRMFGKGWMNDEVSMDAECNDLDYINRYLPSL